MSSREEILELMPPDYRKSKNFKAFAHAEGKRHDQLSANLDNLLDEWFVDTATWTLDRRERIFKISTDSSKPYSERRSVIKSRMRGVGKVDAALIKNVADSYTNGDVEVAFDGRIIIRFNSVIGLPPNLNDLKRVIEDIKPARLRVVFEFAYLLVSDVHNNMTISELEQTSLNKFAGGV